MIKPDDYAKRQQDQQLREKYREVARLHPGVSVHTNANVSMDDDGAFVECSVWVPRAKLGE